MVTESFDVSEESTRIKALVKEVARPKGFERFELQFGEDSTGDAAVWISFLLDAEFPSTPERVRELTSLQSMVKSKLFESEIKRVPYVRFRQEHSTRVKVGPRR